MRIHARTHTHTHMHVCVCVCRFIHTYTLFIQCASTLKNDSFLPGVFHSHGFLAPRCAVQMGSVAANFLTGRTQVRTGSYGWSDMKKKARVCVHDCAHHMSFRCRFSVNALCVQVCQRVCVCARAHACVRRTRSHTASVS